MQQLSEQDQLLIQEYGNDPELLAAIKASMAEEESKQMSAMVPDEPPTDADPETVTVI